MIDRKTGLRGVHVAVVGKRDYAASNAVLDVMYPSRDDIPFIARPWLSSAACWGDTTPLLGRIAVVTGGGRGLGRAMALGLARAGATVIATAARELSELDAVAAKEERLVPMLADVSHDEDCATQWCADHQGGAAASW